MNTKIINNIQIQLLALTNKKFSKRYIEINILPIIKYIAYSDKKKFLIAGSQGIGKSTLIKVLKNISSKICCSICPPRCACRTKKPAPRTTSIATKHCC